MYRYLFDTGIFLEKKTNFKGINILFFNLIVSLRMVYYPIVKTNSSHGKGGVVRLGRRGIMSEEMKIELAKELGFYDVVQKEGWGGIRAKDAGNMVKRAIEIAQQQLANNNK